MRTLTHRTALLTGASRGIGVHIAEALSKEGMKLVLVARSEEELKSLAQTLRDRGAQAEAVAFDLMRVPELDALVEAAERPFGPIDVLVNNAGVEHFGRYHALDPALIQQTLRLNLEAPMLLSQKLMARMLARGDGHLVQIASLAGLAGSPFGESYVASKHGLVGFARALHASRITDGHNVRSSVICPGFVADAGMYKEMETHAGVRATGPFRPCRPEDVARAVVHALQHDVPEIIVNTTPMRPLLALSTLFPRLPEWIAKRAGVFDLFKRVADSRE